VSRATKPIPSSTTLIDEITVDAYNEAWTRWPRQLL
jgi:hypothetical protein